MNYALGMVQVVKIQNEIDNLLKQGYTKVYIYNRLVNNKKIKLGKKRFYEILRSLEKKRIELPVLCFPGQKSNISKQSIPEKEVMTKCMAEPVKNSKNLKPEGLYLQSKNASISTFQQHNKNRSELV